MDITRHCLELYPQNEEYNRLGAQIAELAKHIHRACEFLRLFGVSLDITKTENQIAKLSSEHQKIARKLWAVFEHCHEKQTELIKQRMEIQHTILAEFITENYNDTLEMTV